MLSDAVMYGNFGWRVFPISPNSKIPYKGTNGFKDAKSREDELIKLFEGKEGCNLAVATGKVSDIFVLDIDNKDGGQGSATLDTIELQYGKLPPTVSAQTPTSGRHLYFKRPINIQVPCSTGRIGTGIDVRGEGGYIILPPSEIDGKKYIWEEGHAPFQISIADAPYWLLKIINAKEKVEFVVDLNNTLKAHEPGRDYSLFQISCIARNMGLKNYESLFAFIQGVNLHCCRPALPESDIVKICTSSLKYEDQRIEKIENKETKVEELLIWDRKDTGKLLTNYRNVLNIFKTDESLFSFKYNEFSHQISFIKKPFWIKHWTGEKNLDDNDILQIKQYFEKKHDIQPTVNIIVEAIQTIAYNRSYHPVREYLESLEWDKVPRIHTFLIDYFGAKDTDFNRTVSKLLFCAAVKRIYEPGCKYDYMIILEGKQGIGKSMALRALGGDWFGEVSLTDRDRDTIDKIQGLWIIEVPELQVFQTKEIESLKAFLSTQKDRTRLAYARTSKDFPRQNVFVGTINPDTLGYLRDMTGNRRFLPVECGNILVNDIYRNRDSFFAEAVFNVKKGYDIFISRELENVAEEEQIARVVIDPWEQYVIDWLNDPIKHTSDEFTIADVWKEAFNGELARLTRKEQIRIVHILKKIGYRCEIRWVDGISKRVYLRPDKEIKWE